MKNDKPPKGGAVVYTRVSTKEQIENFSLETQERDCVALCHRNGLSVERVFQERGESAKTEDRTQLKALLDYCTAHKRTIHAVVVWKLDRFSRSTEVHLSLRAFLKRLNITLLSVHESLGESASDWLMELIILGFAEYDNRVRGERTTAGMQAALQSGLWTFQVPLGYQKNGHRIDRDPVIAPIIAEAFQRIATGASKDSVLNWATRRGLRTKMGQRLTPRCFGRLLRNPLYAGQIRTMGVDAAANFRPIVAPDMFERVQAILDGKKVSIRTYTRSHPDFPLRRFVSCGCGKPLTGSWSKGRNGKHPYYHCPNAGCRARAKKHELEAAFLDLVRRLQPDPAYACLFAQLLREAWDARSRQLLERRAQLARALDANAGKRSKLRQKHIYEESISADIFQEESTRLDTERGETEAELALLDHSCRDDVNGLLRFAERLFVRADEAWERGTLEERQRLQQVYFPKGLTYSDSEFRTAETCLFFKRLQPPQSESAAMASPNVFDTFPTTTHCLLIPAA